MKKYILGAVIALGIFVSPVSTHAFLGASDTSAGSNSNQINGILGLLRAFGADQSVINNVETALHGGTPSTTGALIPSDTFVSFKAAQGDSNPQLYNLHLTNGSSAPINFVLSIPNQPSWLNGSINTQTMTLNPGNVMGVGVSVDASKTDGPGTYKTNYIVTGNFSNSPIVIPVTLTVFPASTDTSTITVNYPNGGEQISALGKDVDFRTTWSSSSLSGNVSVYLNSTDGTTCFLGTVPVSQGNFPVSLTNSDGSGYKCPNIPRTITTGQYKILLDTDTNPNNGVLGVHDSSDNYFMITIPSIIPVPTASAPTITFLSTPTLSLQYDSAGKEANITGTVSYKITAGNSSVTFDLNGGNTPPYVASFNGLGSWAISGPTNIPAGQTATYTATLTAEPKVLFAGAYQITPSILGYSANGQWLNLPVSSFINANPSKMVVIIGEVSPYISSVSSDSNGTITIQGARLNLPGNTVKIDGSKTVGATKGDASSMSFPSSSLGLSNGLHYIEITNQQVGNSGAFYFTIANNSTVLTITTASLSDGTVGASYSSRLAGSGGNGYYVWSATGLPAGLSVDSTMCIADQLCQAGSRIYGTPAAAGTYTVTVQLQSGNQTVSKQFTLVISPPTPAPTPTCTNGATNYPTCALSCGPSSRCSTIHKYCMASGINYDSSCNATGAASYTYDPQECTSGTDDGACPPSCGPTSRCSTIHKYCKAGGIYYDSACNATGASNYTYDSTCTAGTDDGTCSPSTVSVSNLQSGTASALNGLNSATNYVWNRNLQIGSPFFADVSALQTALTKEGLYTGDVTGGFYNQTFIAVKAFQQKYGIEATGFVGPDTRAKLNALY